MPSKAPAARQQHCPLSDPSSTHKATKWCSRLPHLSNLAKEIDIHVQEEHRVPNKLDPKRNTPRHIILKMPKVKDKERILKASREKETVTYKGVPIRLSADFSKETLQVRRGWKEVFQVMKGKDLHSR